MRNERGTILLHVMVTSILVALIAATLLRMSLLRVQANARSAKILAEKRDDQAVLSSILSAWNGANGGAGQTCAGVAIAGYSYSGVPGTCSCAYTPNPQTTPPTLPTFATTGGGADSCGISIVSVDR